MRKLIENKQFDEERALYHLTNTDVKNCVFAGPADGESCFKEARDIRVYNTKFSLRYPFWHTKKMYLINCQMDELTRAAIWYAEDGVIEDCRLEGIKAVRECKNITVKNCRVDSPEFGWKSDNITMQNTQITSEYLFFDANNVELDHVEMNGKYSFQYIENLKISDSMLDTKDAFWHSKNITVHNSVLKGEYLAWFSDGLTLIDCKIIGTQPFCYCTNLKMINCTMEETDLAFEYSDVDANIKGNVISIKNPKSGTIIVDSVGTIIHEDPVMECNGKIIEREKEQI